MGRKYQDLITFRNCDTIVAFQLGTTWIKMNVSVKDEITSVSFAKYYHIVKSHIDDLLEKYHQNMWYELCVNPCESIGHECLCNTGKSSLGGDATLASCSAHDCSLTTKQFHMWFIKNHFRILTEEDIWKVAFQLTEEEWQLALAVELGIEINDVTAAKTDNREIRMSSLAILKGWYDNQMNKTEAFSTLCDALEAAKMGGLLTKCLNVQ